MKTFKRIPLLHALVAILFNQQGNGFMSGGGDAGGGDSGGDSGGGDSGGGGDAIPWPEGLDKELHGNETLLKYYNKETKEFNVPNIMKSLIHASSSIGKDKIPVPDDKWTDDQWRETMSKLGLPESVDKYNVENKLPEGLQANEQFYSKFKEVAHSAGILPKQAQALLDWYNNTVGEETKTASDMARSTYEAGVEELKKEYGNAYDRKMTVAQAGMEAFSDEDTMTRMKEKGFMDDPDFTRLMVKIGEGIGEDQFNDDVKKSGNMTPAEIETTIAGFFKPDHPYSIPNHPQKKFWQDEYMRLQRLKLQSKGIQNKTLMG